MKTKVSPPSKVTVFVVMLAAILSMGGWFEWCDKTKPFLYMPAPSPVCNIGELCSVPPGTVAGGTCISSWWIFGCLSSCIATQGLCSAPGGGGSGLTCVVPGPPPPCCR
jgi:hypothetical protein